MYCICSHCQYHVSNVFTFAFRTLETSPCRCWNRASMMPRIVTTIQRATIDPALALRDSGGCSTKTNNANSQVMTWNTPPPHPPKWKVSLRKLSDQDQNQTFPGWKSPVNDITVPKWISLWTRVIYEILFHPGKWNSVVRPGEGYPQGFLTLRGITCPRWVNCWEVSWMTITKTGIPQGRSSSWTGLERGLIQILGPNLQNGNLLNR